MMRRLALVCLLAVSGMVATVPGTAAAVPGPRVLLWVNVEGASHTAAGGNDAARASGVARMRLMVALIRARAADVVAFSELERVQAAAFLRLAPGYRLTYPGADPRNSVAFRAAAFTLIGRGVVWVPYFGGVWHRIPVAWLRDRVTGARLVVIAVHNPADTARFGDQSRWRRVAVARESAKVDAIAAAHPRVGIVLAGDFNSRRPATDAITRRTPLVSAARTFHRLARIDQAFTGRIRLAGYRRWTGPRITAATDHRALYTLTFR